jgi:fused signal recognition particle receptor
MEAQRIAAEEAQRKAAEEAQLKAAEEARLRAAEEEQRKAAEMEQRRAAEARRQAAEVEAETQRKAAEAELETRRKAAEAELETRRKAAEAEVAAQRQAAEAEAEAQQRAAEAEAEAQQRAAEAEEDARRKWGREEAARRTAAEADALRISVQVAAIRERLAGAPIEGSRRETSKAAYQPDDFEDTSSSDRVFRYLALARREGFDLSEKIERGGPEDEETVWLLHESESGLRLIVVTSGEDVREASLHYNLRTEDDALLRATAAEHRDLESRTIYRREACLHDLRARCRRLRATGALERDWKVAPTFHR